MSFEQRNEYFCKAQTNIQMVYIEAEREVKQLKAENAKLRELVAELHQCSRQCGCDHCGYKDGCAMFDRMAQLGIEVDG